MSRRYLIITIIVGLLFVGGITLLTLKSTSSSSSTPTTQRTGLSALFPFLSSGSKSATPASGPQEAVSVTLPAPLPVVALGPVYFKQISTHVVAGLVALPYDKNATTVPTHSATGINTPAVALPPEVRYAEKGTGYIYDIYADGTRETQVAGTVVARAAIAQFGAGGTTVAIRYVKPDNATVGTFLGTVTPPSTPDSGIAGTLAGTFLPDGIIDLAISPDGKSLAYVAPVQNGSIGMSMKMDGTGKKQLFLSPFSEWLIGWSAAGLSATTKAAADIAGYSYAISSTGMFHKVLGPVSGLTTLISPDGKSVLYGIGSAGTMSLHVRTIKGNADVNLGISTLPEKCVWAGDSSAIYCGVPQYVQSSPYPDAWYQGSVHFNDAIWKADPATGITTRLTTGSEGLVDATDLTLSADGSYLFVVNKTDGSLWSLDLDAARAAH